MCASGSVTTDLRERHLQLFVVAPPRFDLARVGLVKVELAQHASYCMPRSKLENKHKHVSVNNLSTCNVHNIKYIGMTTYIDTTRVSSTALKSCLLGAIYKLMTCAKVVNLSVVAQGM